MHLLFNFYFIQKIVKISKNLHNQLKFVNCGLNISDKEKNTRTTKKLKDADQKNYWTKSQ